MDRAEMLATKLSEALVELSELRERMREVNNVAYTTLQVTPLDAKHRKAVELILQYSENK
jgi:hypothetical protein